MSLTINIVSDQEFSLSFPNDDISPDFTPNRPRLFFTAYDEDGGVLATITLLRNGDTWTRTSREDISDLDFWTLQYTPRSGFSRGVVYWKQSDRTWDPDVQDNFYRPDDPAPTPTPAPSSIVHSRRRRNQMATPRNFERDCMFVADPDGAAVVWSTADTDSHALSWSPRSDGVVYDPIGVLVGNVAPAAADVAVGKLRSVGVWSDIDPTDDYQVFRVRGCAYFVAATDFYLLAAVGERTGNNAPSEAAGGTPVAARVFDVAPDYLVFDNTISIKPKTFSEFALMLGVMNRGSAAATPPRVVCNLSIQAMSQSPPRFDLAVR